MVTSNKITVIILSTVLSFFLMFSPYRKAVILLGGILFFLLYMKMFVFRTMRSVQKLTKEQLKEKIEPGDLVFVCEGKDSTFFEPFTVICMMLNEEELHTIYAVEHQSKTYLMNSYITPLFEERKKSFADPNSIIILESNKRVTGWLEPIEEFLNAEAVKNSYVRVVKTKRKAPTFDPSQKKLFQELGSRSLLHCSMAIGKYLESQGLISNRSAYPDFLYYTPDMNRKSLGIVNNEVYQLVN